MNLNPELIQMLRALFPWIGKLPDTDLLIEEGGNEEEGNVADDRLEEIKSNTDRVNFGDRDRNWLISEVEILRRKIGQIEEMEDIGVPLGDQAWTVLHHGGQVVVKVGDLRLLIYRDKS